MKRALLLPLLTALLLAGAGCVQQATAPTGSATPPTGQAQAPASNKFVDQPYYQNAYLISSDPLTPDAQSALTGFKMTKTAQPDGTTRFVLEAVKPGYKTQQVDLKPGEQLYVIEKYLQDDDPVKGEEKNLKDDLIVVVGSDGNVVQGPTDWNP